MPQAPAIRLATALAFSAGVHIVLAGAAGMIPHPDEKTPSPQRILFAALAAAGDPQTDPGDPDSTRRLPPPSNPAPPVLPPQARPTSGEPPEPNSAPDVPPRAETRVATDRRSRVSRRPVREPPRRPEPSADGPGAHRPPGGSARLASEPAAGTPQSRAGDDPLSRTTLEQAFLAELQQTIAAHRFYPPAARAHQIRGRVSVAFVLMADGAIAHTEVRESSGHSILDEAALETLRRVERFKPIPAALGKNNWHIRVPVHFTLP